MTFIIEAFAGARFLNSVNRDVFLQVVERLLI